ncbi:hypothetical protein ACLOJK_015836 [Asimina triloba]
MNQRRQTPAYKQTGKKRIRITKERRGEERKLSVVEWLWQVAALFRIQSLVDTFQEQVVGWNLPPSLPLTFGFDGVKFLG